MTERISRGYAAHHHKDVYQEKLTTIRTYNKKAPGLTEAKMQKGRSSVDSSAIVYHGDGSDWG